MFGREFRLTYHHAASGSKALDAAHNALHTAFDRELSRALQTVLHSGTDEAGVASFIQNLQDSAAGIIQSAPETGGDAQKHRNDITTKVRSAAKRIRQARNFRLQ